MLPELPIDNLVPIDTIRPIYVRYSENEGGRERSSFSILEGSEQDETVSIHRIGLQPRESIKAAYDYTATNLEKIATQLRNMGLPLPAALERYAQATEYLATDESIEEVRQMAKIHEEVHSIQEIRLQIFASLHTQVLELNEAISLNAGLDETQRIIELNKLWGRWVPL